MAATATTSGSKYSKAQHVRNHTPWVGETISKGESFNAKICRKITSKDFFSIETVLKLDAERKLLGNQRSVFLITAKALIF